MRKVVAAAVGLVALGLLLVLAVPLLLVAPFAASAAQGCVGQPVLGPGSPGSATPGSATPGPATPGPGSGSPAPAGPAELSQVALQNAASIVAVGQELTIPAQGIVVALAVASQESDFRNLANDGLGGDLRPEQRDVGRSLKLLHDGVGTDHGSVGVFQQQYPWWGQLEELMDPPTSARLFYAALAKVPGWEAMPVTVAAQSVQRSKWPDAYADDEPRARALFTQLADGSATGGLCGTGTAMDCAPTGLAAETGLTPDALRVLRCVQQQFGDHTYYGVGDRAANATSDHPAGRAVDVMIDGWQTPAGNTHGWEVARWVAANAASLGVKNVIFDVSIWNLGDPVAGPWAPYSHPSGATDANSLHRNHVHISVFGNAAQGAAAVSAARWTLPLAPSSYRLSSGFGPRTSPGGIGSTNHTGLDFAAAIGTPILAAASGTVTHTGRAGGYGNLVVITTGADVETYYAHQLDGSLRVRTGQHVNPGQVIGAVGTTGNSTGPHLHFEVRLAGTPVDPVTYLRQYGVDPGTPP